MQSLLGFLLRFVPKNLLSYLVGRVVQIQWPQPLGRWSVRWFARRYQLNLEEAELPLNQYHTIGQLFTRRLQPEARPVEAGFVHPVDGELTVHGRIQAGELIQAKGKKYTLSDLLGSEEALAAYENGYYLTYYLCPTDYHRVHAPEDGEIRSCVHMPGRLWPVNPWSVRHVSQLFSVNERVIIRMRTLRGPLVVIMVGATNVGRMTMSFDQTVVTNQEPLRQRRRPRRVDYKSGITVTKGQELGVFNMGSTVIVITPSGFLEPGEIPAEENVKVRLGRSLSRLAGAEPPDPESPHRIF